MSVLSPLDWVTGALIIAVESILWTKFLPRLKQQQSPYYDVFRWMAIVAVACVVLAIVFRILIVLQFRF